MTRTFLALATLALLSGCGMTPAGTTPTGTPAARAIGCIPGECGGSKPVPKPCR